jgi:hypothetical protein
VFLNGLYSADRLLHHVSWLFPNQPRQEVARREYDQIVFLNASALGEIVQLRTPIAFYYSLAIAGVPDGDFDQVADSPVGAAEE